MAKSNVFDQRSYAAKGFRCFAGMEFHIFKLSFLKNILMKIALIILILVGFVRPGLSSVTNQFVESRGKDELKEFVLGSGTNGIRCGVARFSTPSKIFICLFPVDETTRPEDWSAPPGFQRGDFSLLDSTNREVPYKASYRPSCRVFRSISEVPKDTRNVHMGTIWGPPFSMPYDQISVVDIFRLRNSGDYKLTVREHIMMIMPDGELKAVELPSVIFSIHIGDDDLKN